MIKFDQKTSNAFILIARSESPAWSDIDALKCALEFDELRPVPCIGTQFWSIVRK